MLFGIFFAVITVSIVYCRFVIGPLVRAGVIKLAGRWSALGIIARVPGGLAVLGALIGCRVKMESWEHDSTKIAIRRLKAGVDVTVHQWRE